MGDLLDDVVLREVSNGAWFIINFVFFAVALVGICYRVHHPPEPFAAPAEVRFHRLAIEGLSWLSIFLFGAVQRSGYIWLLLFLQNSGRDTEWMVGPLKWVTVSSAVFAIVGGIGCVRVFAPRLWGRFFWVVVAVLAVFLPVALHIIW